MLTDTDVVILEDRRAVLLEGSVVASRVVGGPHTPVHVLRDVFSSAGVALPEFPLERYPDQQTVKGNANGGVYLIPCAVLVDGGKSWARWRDGSSTTGLIGKGRVHVDQVAMAITLAEGSLRPHHLERRWNFPSQNSRVIAANAPSAAIIHYHRNTEPTELLNKTGVEAIDLQMDRANAAVAAVWSDVYRRRARGGRPKSCARVGAAPDQSAPSDVRRRDCKRTGRKHGARTRPASRA